MDGKETKENGKLKAKSTFDSQGLKSRLIVILIYMPTGTKLKSKV